MYLLPYRCTSMPHFVNLVGLSDASISCRIFFPLLSSQSIWPFLTCLGWSWLMNQKLLPFNCCECEWDSPMQFECVLFLLSIKRFISCWRVVVMKGLLQNGIHCAKLLYIFLFVWKKHCKCEILWNFWSMNSIAI